MCSREGIAPIFARAYRLLAGLVVRIKDKFFSDLLAYEADKLLAEYVKLLKYQAGERQSADGAAPNHVAQCSQTLTARIKVLLNLIAILKYLNHINLTTSLFLERELLLLESITLDSALIKLAPRVIGRRRVSANGVGLKTIKRRQRKFRITRTHRKIIDLLNGKGTVPNLDIFNGLSNITKRSLKRNFSRLIKEGIVKRQISGKKVFYSLSNSASRPTTTINNQTQ